TRRRVGEDVIVADQAKLRDREHARDEADEPGEGDSRREGERLESIDPAVRQDASPPLVPQIAGFWRPAFATSTSREPAEVADRAADIRAQVSRFAWPAWNSGARVLSLSLPKRTPFDGDGEFTSVFEAKPANRRVLEEWLRSRALPQEWAASTHSEIGEGVVRTRAAFGSPSLRWKQRYRHEAGGCRPDLSGQPLTISEANERSVGAASCVVPSPRFIGVAAARQDRTLARNHLPQLAGVRSAAPPGQDL